MQGKTWKGNNEARQGINRQSKHTSKIWYTYWAQARARYACSACTQCRTGRCGAARLAAERRMETRKPPAQAHRTGIDHLGRPQCRQA
eukprot:1160323-Pelagomonas_calceolata.AAC.5